LLPLDILWPSIIYPQNKKGSYQTTIKLERKIKLFSLLGYGPDAPPTKVFLVKSSSDSKSDMSEYDKRTSLKVQRFSWMTVLHFIFWLFIWSSYVLLLSSMILKKVGGLNEMFEK